MKVSKTAIFLFELMMVILIFSIAAAVCTSIFSKAYGFSTESKDLTMAVITAESMAEEFKAGKEPNGDMLFDENWKATTDEDKAKYFIRPDITEDGEMKVMDISVKKMGHGGVGPADVYGLQVKSYGK
jgi:type II secretory pathway pseudopilin PulG